MRSSSGGRPGVPPGPVSAAGVCWPPTGGRPLCWRSTPTASRQASRKPAAGPWSSPRAGRGVPVVERVWTSSGNPPKQPRTRGQPGCAAPPATGIFRPARRGGRTGDEPASACTGGDERSRRCLHQRTRRRGGSSFGRFVVRRPRSGGPSAPGSHGDRTPAPGTPGRCRRRHPWRPGTLDPRHGAERPRSRADRGDPHPHATCAGNQGDQQSPGHATAAGSVTSALGPR
jgi:hypothetical protein